MDSNSKKLIEFPDDFLWGVSVSHFQVEGHSHEVDGRLSDWSLWTASSGKILDGTNADQACQFHSRYKEDIELAADLNLNAFRTSLNWAALMPEPEGKFNSEVRDYYLDVFECIKGKDKKLFLSLFHFCLPQWLAEKGGWTDSETPERFAEFASLAQEAFGDYVDFWVTINEPLVYAYHGFVTGTWPPGNKVDYLNAFTVVRNMLSGHALAYKNLKADDSSKPVSFSNHWTPFLPEKPWSPFDQMVTLMRDSVFNHIFPASIESGKLELPLPLTTQKEFHKLGGPIPGLKGTMDFLGVNYYSRELSRFEFKWPIDFFGSKSKHCDYPVNDLGWETYPKGLYRVLSQDLKPYMHDSQGDLRPIYVTENGFCRKFSADLSDGDWSLEDDDRCGYLKSHLVAMKEAMDSGANVKGYIHWSLIDNFEWAEGLSARFGLHRVRYDNQERQKRKSADFLASVAKTNKLET